jgi:glycosyltransferase involved in cell wall biosynthesis
LQLVEKCRDSQNFKALGFIEDINSLANEIDYFMLCSEREGLPICLIEATMQGKPILANDVGGNLEICMPGKNGIFLDSPGNLASILNGLLSISDDEYIRMCQNSRAHYEATFKYDQMIAGYLSILNQMQKSYNRAVPISTLTLSKELR